MISLKRLLNSKVTNEIVPGLGGKGSNTVKQYGFHIQKNRLNSEFGIFFCENIW